MINHNMTGTSWLSWDLAHRVPSLLILEFIEIATGNSFLPSMPTILARATAENKAIAMSLQFGLVQAYEQKQDAKLRHCIVWVTSGHFEAGWSDPWMRRLLDASQLHFSLVSAGESLDYHQLHLVSSCSTFQKNWWARSFFPFDEYIPWTWRQQQSSASTALLSDNYLLDLIRGTDQSRGCRAKKLSVTGHEAYTNQTGCHNSVPSRSSVTTLFINQSTRCPPR